MLPCHLSLSDPAQLQPGRPGLVARRHHPPGPQPGRAHRCLVCRPHPVPVRALGLPVLVLSHAAGAGQLPAPAPGSPAGAHAAAGRCQAGQSRPHGRPERRCPGDSAAFPLCLGTLDWLHPAAGRLQRPGRLASLQPERQSAAGPRRAAGGTGCRSRPRHAGCRRWHAGASAAHRHRLQPGHGRLLDVHLRAHRGRPGRQRRLHPPETGCACRSSGRRACGPSAGQPAGACARGPGR